MSQCNATPLRPLSRLDETDGTNLDVELDGISRYVEQLEVPHPDVEGWPSTEVPEPQLLSDSRSRTMTGSMAFIAVERRTQASDCAAAESGQSGEGAARRWTASRIPAAGGMKQIGRISGRHSDAPSD